MPTLHAVALACDFHPRFLNFFPTASYFWQKNFGLLPHLGVVYEPHQSALAKRFKAQFSNFGNIILLEAHPEATLGNQAKLARWFIASRVASPWTTIDDLDTIHVHSRYLTGKFKEVPEGKLLAIGQELYEGHRHEGAFPMGNFSGSSENFKSLFDLQDDEVKFPDFVERFRGRKEYRTNPFFPIDEFSDEELLRDIRSEKLFDVNLHFAKRDLDINVSWLDRSRWISNRRIMKRKDFFESVNFPRPFYLKRGMIYTALRAIDKNTLTLEIPIPKYDFAWNLENFLKKKWSPR